MKVSVWRQDKSGARWRRIGVVEMEIAGAYPFKVVVSYLDDRLPRRWPRWHFWPLERWHLSLFGA